MNVRFCEQLDEFLLGELTGGKRDEFREHLAGCHVCRAEVAAQEAVDRLLSAAVEETETCPPALMARVTSGFQIERRRRVARRWAGAIAACAGLMLAIWIWQSPPGQRTVVKRDANHVVERDSLENNLPLPETELVSEAPAHKADPEVVVRFPDEFIGVPIKSSNPNITIFRVYPVIRYGEQADASNGVHGLDETIDRSQL